MQKKLNFTNKGKFNKLLEKKEVQDFLKIETLKRKVQFLDIENIMHLNNRDVILWHQENVL